MFCGDDTLIGRTSNEVTLTPLRCKRWQCDECLPNRLTQLRAIAAAGRPQKFITLTVNPSRYDHPDDAAKDLVRCWRLLRQQLIRDKYATKVPFLAVIEDTKAGWPHLHLLVRIPYVPQAYLSHLARRWIGAPIVDIRAVYNRRHASRYIAKYLAKGPALHAGCKRYWRSQDYCPPNPNETPVADRAATWWREREHIDYIAWTLIHCGWTATKATSNRVTLQPTNQAKWLWYEHDPPDNVPTKNAH